jgi:methionine biosynthesis protein MetW
MAVSGRSNALSLGCAEAHPRAPDGAAGELRRDLRLIAEMIDPGARVLDIGCGDGALLSHLVRHKNVDGRGMELSQSGVNSCVAYGLSVIQGDADRDLEAYPTGAFDVVVLSQTLQATRQPRKVLETLVRIGRRAIVSFPNFGFWRIRLHLLFCGRMPMSHLLAHPWYETPNIHLCTIRDFVAMCDEIGVRVERSVTLDRNGQPYSLDPRGSLANLLAEQGVFVLSENRGETNAQAKRPTETPPAAHHRDSPCGAGV